MGLRGLIAARLGYDPFVSTGTTATLVVLIKRSGSGLEGTFRRVDVRGMAYAQSAALRSVSTDCSELASSLAIEIVIAIDPLRSIRNVERARTITWSPSTPETAAPVRSDAARADGPVASQTRSTEHATFVLGAGPSMSFGSLPRASWGGRALVGVGYARFEANMEGRFDPPVTTAAKGGEVSTSFVLLTLAPCMKVLRGAQASMLVCAQGSVGALRGTASGFARNREENSWYVSAGARVVAEHFFQRSPFGVRGTLEAQVALRPLRQMVSDEVVWTTPVVSLSLIPTLVGRFP